MESQNVGSAFNILSTMESEGCAPDLVLYNVLIDCLAKIGRYNDALDIFVGLPKRKLEPDSYTLTSILSAICMSQKFSLLPMLVSGRVIQADLVACNSLLSYFCKAGFPSHVVEFYSDMIERGFTPDGYSFVGLLRGLCGAGKVEEAINVYHGIVMNHPVLDAHIHTVIMHGLIKVGYFHRAIRLFRKAVVEKYPLDVVSYTVAICGLLKGGRTKEASTLYGQMKEVGIDPNAHTYKVMLFGFCKDRVANMVKQMLQEMIDARIELDFNTFNRVTNKVVRHEPQPARWDRPLRNTQPGGSTTNKNQLQMIHQCHLPRAVPIPCF
ncbi:hypothetical protein L1049_014271 [Liquidambar formosana]|uniref:Pentatricopeptide repeat-containing protein n=1 Tax=Liquidambar formosana TaxID=63359 RepID=A0AAP0RQ68_LIQFO